MRHGTSSSNPYCPLGVPPWSIGPRYRGGPSLRATRHPRMNHPHLQGPPYLAPGPPWLRGGERRARPKKNKSAKLSPLNDGIPNAGQGLSQPSACGPGRERNDQPIISAPPPLPELTPSDNGPALTGRYTGYPFPPGTSSSNPSCPLGVPPWNIGPRYRGGPSRRTMRHPRMNHPSLQEPPYLAPGPPCWPPAPT